MSAGSAAGISFVEKARKGGTKNHVTHAIHYTIIGISSNIVQEEMYCLFGGDGGLGLSGCDGT